MQRLKINPKQILTSRVEKQSQIMNRVQSGFYQIFHFLLRISQSFNNQKTVLNTDPLFPYLNFDKLDN